MQYFSIISRQGDDPPRTCAMIQDANIEGAAEKARRLIRSDQLPHVERNADFSIRRSSRRETSLLQSFLSSSTGDNMSTYLPADLDSLLSRRNTLVTSFFIALYLDPRALKARFDPGTPGRKPLTGTTGGSGGVAHETVEQSKPHDVHSVEPAEKTEHSPSSEQMASVEGPDDHVVGDDNQISALEDIVNGGSDAGDDELDLF